VVFRQTFLLLVIWPVALATLLICSLATAQDTTKPVLANKKQALERALLYAGFEISANDSCVYSDARATDTNYQDSSTPFFSDSVSGERRWVVTFDSVYLDFKGHYSDKTLRRQVRKTFCFVLDPESGRLLTVFSAGPGCPDSLPPLANAMQVEDRTRDFEHYVGLGEDVPPVSFSEALKEARPSSPVQACDVRGWLMYYCRFDREPRLCWVIITRGAPGIPLPSPPTNPPGMVTEERFLRGAIRSIVDAKTGKLLSFDGY
jgi:hypothetical protein